MESILTSIKKMLGIEENYTHFDADLVMHINSVFFILTQMGVGPSSGFTIQDKSGTWNARYKNAVSLWNEIYITSVFPPEELYRKMVDEDLRGRDKQQQLLRRITDITYCYKSEAGAYKKHTIPMSEYEGYDKLKAQALKLPAGFIPIDESEVDELPFD